MVSSSTAPLPARGTVRSPSLFRRSEGTRRVFLVFSACPWLEMTVSLTYPGDRGEAGWDAPSGLGGRFWRVGPGSCYPVRWSPYGGLARHGRGYASSFRLRLRGSVLFFWVLSVDVSADVCAIGVLVKIVAQEPHIRITRQKTRTRQNLAWPELPAAQLSSAFGLARPPLNFRFRPAPALACGQLREAHLLILFLLRFCAHAHRSWP